jgi:hypothetical protein
MRTIAQAAQQLFRNCFFLKGDGTEKRRSYHRVPAWLPVLSSLCALMIVHERRIAADAARFDYFKIAQLGVTQRRPPSGGPNAGPQPMGPTGPVNPSAQTETAPAFESAPMAKDDKATLGGTDQDMYGDRDPAAEIPGDTMDVPSPAGPGTNTHQDDAP